MTVCKKEADTLKKDCIDRTCDNFGVSKLKEHLTTHLSDQVETQIQWKSWEMVDKENGKRMALEQRGYVEKHFFGSRHGKGPCDGEIGVLKRCAGNAVKSRQVIIADALISSNMGGTI
ncbi:hypothetical protein HOLleu_44024 [Holothuria leucospilota]|uniref:Uncharacterized protein n=1 Tax=Holothuria leucospilota TaxID=206669 RepID=A0A9Q0Y945_HOLLE|nr:hypothetical protein HOLleu_44024 [Holothuria leucospilota]